MTRSYLSSARIDALKGELAPKEQAILGFLSELRLASASQIERLFFHADTARNRRRVLEAMTERGLLFRLDRTIGGKRAGSVGYLYALGLAGRRILAQGQPQRVRQASTPGAPFLLHTLAVTEIAVRLHEVERQGLVEVMEFQGEPRSWRRYPGPGGGQLHCKPDAYIRLGIGQFSDDYFLEVDRGTESPATLTRQLEAYRRYWASGIEQSWRGVFPRVLWLVPDERRQQVLVDLCSRQPAESWKLHLVTTYENAIATMTEGTS